VLPPPDREGNTGRFFFGSLGDAKASPLKYWSGVITRFLSVFNMIYQYRVPFLMPIAKASPAF